MRDNALLRIQRVLAAKKLGEMAQLGARQALANRAREDAQKYRLRSRRLAAVSAAPDMALTCRWQQHAEQAARAGEAAAAQIEQDAQGLRAALSQTLGREAVIKRLIAQQRRRARQLAERRSEG